MGRAGSGHTRRKVKPKGRERRRLKAVQWVDSHWGKPANMLRKYRRTFGVDWGCAIAELQVLGVVFPPEYLNQLRVTIAHQFADEKRYEPITLAGFSSDSDDGPCSDDTFAFIAGYTSGGVPYGSPGRNRKVGVVPMVLRRISRGRTPSRVCRVRPLLVARAFLAVQQVTCELFAVDNTVRRWQAPTRRRYLVSSHASSSSGTSHHCRWKQASHPPVHPSKIRLSRGEGSSETSSTGITFCTM